MRRGEGTSVEAKVGPDSPFFDIIADAYRVFDYPKPSSIEVCTMCCMIEAIERDFFNPPIDQLPLSYIRDWFSAAYDPPGIAKSTWGYLLPRVLEILATGSDVASVGLEVSLRRFETGNPDNWSGEEWDVLDAFQRLYLQLQLQRSGPFARTGDCLDDVLCMFALGGWRTDELVSQLEHADDRLLAERLYSDWRTVHSEDGAIWSTAFWEGDGREKIWAFYTSQTLHERMAALALADDTDPELAEKAYRVANVIEAFQD